MKPEDLLVKRVVTYLRGEYPSIIYNINLAADMRVSIGVARKNKALLGKWSKGHPDMIIYKTNKKYCGLFIELKATKTVPNSDHTRRQEAFMAILRLQGYRATFCCGYEECVKEIDWYMALKKKKVKT